MKAKLNNSMFHYLSKEITQGCALQAILRANEYLNAEDPLRLALIAKAKTRASYQQLRHNWNYISLIEKGLSLSELSSAQITQIEQAITKQVSDLPQATTKTIPAKFASHRRVAFYSRKKAFNKSYLSKKRLAVGMPTRAWDRGAPAPLDADH